MTIVQLHSSYYLQLWESSVLVGSCTAGSSLMARKNFTAKSWYVEVIRNLNQAKHIVSFKASISMYINESLHLLGNLWTKMPHATVKHGNQILKCMEMMPPKTILLVIKDDYVFNRYSNQLSSSHVNTSDFYVLLILGQSCNSNHFRKIISTYRGRFLPVIQAAKIEAQLLLYNHWPLGRWKREFRTGYT